MSDRWMDRQRENRQNKETGTWADRLINIHGDK